MATSGTIVFRPTAADIIAHALEMARVLPEGEIANAAQSAAALRALNGVLKSWQAAGAPLTHATLGQLTTADATAAYALTPRAVAVRSAAVRAAGVDRVLFRLTREGHARIAAKAAVGTPSYYWIARDDLGVTMHLYPVPNDALTVIYTYQRVVEDVGATSNEVDVEAEHLEALAYVLASRMLDLYGSSGDAAADAAIREQAAAMWAAALQRQVDPVQAFAPGLASGAA